MISIAPQPRQEPLDEGLEAAHLKVVGVSMDAIQEPPELDQTMKILVTCVCTDRIRSRRKDNELRFTAILTAFNMEVIEGPTTPIGEPNLFSDQEDDGH